MTIQCGYKYAVLLKEKKSSLQKSLVALNLHYGFHKQKMQKFRYLKKHIKCLLQSTQKKKKDPFILVFGISFASEKHLSV
ncbi:hypothetical protein FKM82_029919 [Ascaphus truei]